MPAAPRVLVDGREFLGWKELTVHRSVSEVAGSVELSVFPTRPWPFGRNAHLEVRFGDQPLLTGFPFKEQRVGGGEWLVTGFDSTLDLAHSIYAAGQPLDFPGKSAFDVAKIAAEPFGIRVATTAPTVERLTQVSDLGIGAGQLPYYHVDWGFRAWDVIEGALRQAGLLGYGPGDGSLLVTLPGRARSPVALKQGRNLVRVTRIGDWSERFSYYVVRGFELAATGPHDTVVATPGPTIGEARDDGVGRYRPTLVVGEMVSSPEMATALAQWDAIWRAAMSMRLVAQVAGWDRRGPGAPGSADAWLVNELVPVDAPEVDVGPGELLTASIDYSATRESGGLTTTLTLVRPDAFARKPVVEGLGVGGADEGDGG